MAAEAINHPEETPLLMLLLFLIHQYDERTLTCFRDIDPGEGIAKELLVDLDAADLPIGHEATGFTFAGLKQRGYSLMVDSIVPGNTPWPVIDRFLATDHDFVWLIEGDVHFTGNWAEFFSSFSKVEEKVSDTFSRPPLGPSQPTRASRSS